VRRLALGLVAAAALAAVAATAAHASTWCGGPQTTDQLPQVVPGPSIHFVYAYPSDAPDRLAQFGTTMETDAEAIDAWWRAQDPTRTPRFDTYPYACGPQIDITDVKLTNTQAELQPIGTRFENIIGALAGDGLSSEWEVYLIYFDGANSGDDICGQGETQDPTKGGSYAIVYPGSCPDEPTAAVAAHELGHALGAVTSPAPHECPPPNDGHVCDYNHDLMYPFADGTALTGLVLDQGHDDYYDAPGVGFDVRTSLWLRHLDAVPAHLAVTLTGAGTVSSDVPGVLCPATCGTDWESGQSVTLSATASLGARFVRWSGACSGQLDCTVTLANSLSVSALFAPNTYRLLLDVTGQGNIVVAPAGNQCHRNCRFAVPSYAAETLRAVARPGWAFKRWSGSCTGTRLTCSLPMTKDAGANAVFVKKAKPKKKA